MKKINNIPRTILFFGIVFSLILSAAAFGLMFISPDLFSIIPRLFYGFTVLAFISFTAPTVTILSVVLCILPFLGYTLTFVNYFLFSKKKTILAFPILFLLGIDTLTASLLMLSGSIGAFICVGVNITYMYFVYYERKKIKNEE